MSKIIRAKAPLRIGLAGGGTDVSPYSDIHGGAILNITLDKYAYATLKPMNNGKIILKSYDLEEHQELNSEPFLEMDGALLLLKGVYNRMVKDYTKKPLSFELTTHVDVPKGSGMGTSSTITVAILGAFVEWLKLPLGEYDIARLAYSIEREDLKMAGGKQDQYAATFGGVNFMEFFEDRVIVNPLRVKSSILNELQYNLLLYYTGTSRLSSKIIESQVEEFRDQKIDATEAAHELKALAFEMKESLLVGKVNDIGMQLQRGWSNKKKLSKRISNPTIDALYEKALENGATGGKISGAGGGGFFTFYVPGNAKFKVMDALKEFGGEFRNFNFSNEGMVSWTTE